MGTATADSAMRDDHVSGSLYCLDIGCMRCMLLRCRRRLANDLMYALSAEKCCEAH
jgi:hypothetical protein